MKNIIYIALIIIISLFVSSLFTSISFAEWVNVKKVFDGDTFLIDTKQKIRVLKLDTPESIKKGVPPQPCAIEASNFAKELLTGKKVKLDDKVVFDKYGRRLSSVKLDDGRDYTDVMTKAGFNKLKKKAMRPDCITKIIL